MFPTWGLWYMNGLFGLCSEEGDDRHLPKKQLTAMYLERQNHSVGIYHLQKGFVLETVLLFVMDFFFQVFYSKFSRTKKKKSCKLFTIQNRQQYVEIINRDIWRENRVAPLAPNKMHQSWWIILMGQNDKKGTVSPKQGQLVPLTRIHCCLVESASQQGWNNSTERGVNAPRSPKWRGNTKSN